MIVTETERLTLRYALGEDAAALRSVFCDDEVMRYSDGTKTDDWIQSWIARMNQSYEERGYGLWIITQAGDTTAIGYCGLTWFDDINGRPEVEVGYRLARKFWNHGYATEAATAVRDLSFSKLGLNRLISIIDPENLRSIRVAKKIGMTYHCDIMFEGYDHPDNVYLCERE